LKFTATTKVFIIQGCTTFFLLISQAKQQPKAEFQREVSKLWVKSEKEIEKYPLAIFA
jgi:hypothetical protein